MSDKAELTELLDERDRLAKQYEGAEVEIQQWREKWTELTAVNERQQRIIDLWKDEVNGADPERYQELLIREARIMEGKE